MSTLIVYPDAGTGATTVDGTIRRATTSETLATIIAGAGTTAFPTSAEGAVAELVGSTTTNEYNNLYRAIHTFDTSSIDGGSVDSATISLYGSFKLNSIGDIVTHIVASTPANDNALVAADYSQLDTTSFGNIAYSAYSTTAYNVFTLNSSGESNINTSGISRFGVRSGWDIGIGSPTWANTTSYTRAYFADETGTTKDPKLTVEYTEGGGTVDALFFAHNF